ncbi:FAD-dependent oxidoreductase [Rhodococcus sp. ACPA1]|uniref:FAD-dependent oxidoreductase n=1 Tax=Rhodococcus sp. ACPA1 TaxID=2028572 RepID=UPI0015CE6B91|nr:FAD-dependent oxidoreductase [Rhodococcus sp. ACPA1]
MAAARDSAVDSGASDGLVVVGGGLAGLTAAVRATELGIKVVVLEAGTEIKYPTNSRYTGGVFHVAFLDVHTDPAKLTTAVERATAGHADPGLTAVLTQRISTAVRWLGNHGATIGTGGDLKFMKNMLHPYSLQVPGFSKHWPDKGADRLLAELERQLIAAGGRFLRGARATSLLMQDKRCHGAVVRRADGRIETYLASAVLLADGGFQGNREMIRRYISPRPEALCQRGAATGMGDGIRMAQAVGAQVADMDRFYGHVQCSEALTDDQLWPYPILDIVASAAVVVDSTGNRFTDEGLGGVSIANAIARQNDPLKTFVILDNVLWESIGKQFLLPPNPTIEERGATVFRAAGLRSLAHQTGLPAGPLESTIDEYNRAVQCGNPGALDVPRTGESSTLGHPPATISKQGMVAIPLCAGITYTMGGVIIDNRCRVIDRDGRAIQGLLAAGSTIAGLEGGPASGYIGGLAKALVLGLTAAEQVAGADPSGPLGERSENRGG